MIAQPQSLPFYNAARSASGARWAIWALEARKLSRQSPTLTTALLNAPNKAPTFRRSGMRSAVAVITLITELHVLFLPTVWHTSTVRRPKHLNSVHASILAIRRRRQGGHSLTVCF